MESNTRKGFYLFFLFFKSMMFAFTSGTAALPSIERGIVDKKKWLTSSEFWVYPVMGQSLPGVISIHNSILIGHRIAGPFGAFMSAAGTIAPAFLCMLVIAAVFLAYVDNPYIQGAIRGIRLISTALILGNAVHMLQNSSADAFSRILVIFAVFSAFFFKISAFWIIILCGAAGVVSVLAGNTSSASKSKESGK